jgi:hypothetical protein
MIRIALLASTLLLIPLTLGCGEKSPDDDSSATQDSDGNGEDSTPPEDTDPDTSTDTVSVLKAELSTTVRYYEYQGETATIRYFAVIDAAGAYHTAFDACDACYPAGLGYSQDGDEMVCNNCRNRYAIEELGTQSGGGGCWPGHLPFTETDTELLILVSDLESGSYYFE